MKKIQPVILSGGSGTRLWPLSRQSLPKQLLPLTGDESLLQQTAKRVGTAQFEKPIVIANEEHRFVVAEQLREINIAPSHLVLEPMGRNTAPAAAVASLLAEPDALLLVVAADHHITGLDKFYSDIEIAAKAAAEGKIVTLGLKPTAPETGYGYLEIGAPLKNVPGAFTLASFTEKPERNKAETLLKTHLWNSGMFLFQAKTFVALLESLQPEILKRARKAIETTTRDLDFIRLDKEIFSAMPSISIDYAIMEHTAIGALVPATFGWCDLGAWDALWDITPKDAAGNAIKGNAVALHTKHSYIHSEGTLTAVLGLEDVIVVTTPDAVLVANRNKAQQLREMVEELKRRNLPQVETHRKVYRPWGYYDGLDNGERFQVKRLFLKPGGKISLQKHHKRAEHWVVVEGTALITLNDKTFDLHENESVHIPIGATHRIENKQKTPLILIEVQTGKYLGEDDIVRFSDSYGRK